jgi:hypothetical protein
MINIKYFMYLLLLASVSAFGQTQEPISTPRLLLPSDYSFQLNANNQNEIRQFTIENLKQYERKTLTILIRNVHAGKVGSQGVFEIPFDQYPKIIQPDRDAIDVDFTEGKPASTVTKQIIIYPMEPGRFVIPIHNDILSGDFKLILSVSPKEGDNNTFQVFGVLKDRKIIKKYLPRYPRWAEEAGVEADVALPFEVLPDGRVSKVETTGKQGEMEPLAAKALWAYVFEPLPADAPQETQKGVMIIKFRLR